MKPCKCLPPIENPTHRAFIATWGVCVYATGASIEDAIERVKAHAKKDRIPRERWTDLWVEDMTGSVIIQEEEK